MTRPVLLGGRSFPDSSTFLGWLVRVWLPVLVMLVAIAFESPHIFSSNNTSGWMRTAYQALAGPVSDAAWAGVHHHIRKTGHFTGYGLLGLAWMRAWLIFWLQTFSKRPASVWRTYSFMMAVFCTMLVASLDELHQSYMADRTGVVSDVLLDTGGAVAMLLACLLVTISRSRRAAREGAQPR